MKIKIVFIGLFLLGFTFASTAQTKTPKVTDRQIHQQRRILKGAKNGELTKKEFKQLEKQQRSIHRTKKLAKADGKVTNKERALIHFRQNRASRNIAKKKHNKIDRN